MGPPFGGQHGHVGRGGGWFQIRWGIVSEKLPVSWGNDSEKSHSPHASRQFLSNASGPESPSASRGGIARTELPGARNQMLAVKLLITLRSPWFLSARHPRSTAYARSSAMQPVPARTRAIRQVPAKLKVHWMLRKTIKRASLRNNRKQMVGWDGIEPPTPGFSDLGLSSC